MKTQRIIFLFMLATLFIITSCEKEPGEGGNSTISGKVYVKDYNGTFTVLNGEYYGPDEDVYIVYGGKSDNTFGYDDDVKTCYDGTYEFKFLRPGKYTVYAYSKDSNFQEPSGVIPIIYEIEISEKNQEVEVPDLVIFK